MHAAIFLLSLMLPATAQPAVALKAGIGRVEITPSGPMGMYGYANGKCGPANGTHDPLFAKVLVLEAGDSRMALVTTDLGSFVSENLRRDVASKLNIRCCCFRRRTRTRRRHFCHLAARLQTGDQSKAYLAEIEGKIFRAIEEASRSMFPARLAIAKGSMQLGYNRLLVREDGRARAVFDNLERIPYGPVDPELVLLRVEDTLGQAKALLVHYAAHAVVLGPTSCKYSADYPGALQSAVERELEGTQVMFVQGGAGDINPLFQGRSGTEEQDFAVMEKMGQLLAAEVLRVHKTVKPLAPVTGPIRVRSEVLTFPERWEKDKTMEVGITTILLGRELAIATIPGEPFHKLQKTWKALQTFRIRSFMATRGARAERGPATFRICIQPHTAATARMPAHASRSAPGRRSCCAI